MQLSHKSTSLQVCKFAGLKVCTQKTQKIQKAQSNELGQFDMNSQQSTSAQGLLSPETC